MKPSKEVIVDEMLSEMDFGITYTECFELNKTKWNLTKGTFVRYWKEASERYLAANLSDKLAAQEVRVEAIKNRAENAIMSKEERMELLTKIARGEIEFLKEVPSKFGPQEITARPDFNERRAAMQELNKMEGDYAPLKKDITTNGESIAPPPIFNIVLEDGEL